MYEGVCVCACMGVDGWVVGGCHSNWSALFDFQLPRDF